MPYNKTTDGNHGTAVVLFRSCVFSSRTISFVVTQYTTYTICVAYASREAAALRTGAPRPRGEPQAHAMRSRLAKLTMSYLIGAGWPALISVEILVVYCGDTAY